MDGSKSPNPVETSGFMLCETAFGELLRPGVNSCELGWMKGRPGLY